MPYNYDRLPSYSGKGTCPNLTCRLIGAGLQGVEVTMGCLSQPLQPRQGGTEQAGSSVDTRETVDNLELTDERGNASQIVQAIGVYVAGQLNESVERLNHRRRCQQAGETFDDILLSLRELAKTCKFCSNQLLIEGMIDGDTVENILLREGLDLGDSHY